MTELVPSSVFLQYQSATLDAIWNHKVVVVEKSRRTGLSWAASFIADLFAGMDRSAGGMDVFYMGYNLEMAREFIDYCAEHASILQGVAVKVQESLFHDPDKPEKDIKVFRMDLASGFKVLALPSVPRALRGMQGLVILDEAAFHDDLAELLKAALALLMWGGKVLIISTHNGDTNPFNVLVQDIRAGRKPFRLLRITFDDALRDGLYHKICAKDGSTWSAERETAWRQEIIDFYGDAADEELFCIPSPSTGSAIPLALIEARSTPVPVLRWSCKTDFALLPDSVREAEARRFCEVELLPHLLALDPKTQHALGSDFGRSGDLSVFWPLAIERSLLRRTPFLVELRNVPFEQQKQTLWFILDRLHLLRGVKMDARGNGQWLAEVTVQRYGGRVEAVMLSEAWYRDNMPQFKAAFEDGMLTVPADMEVHDDLRSLQIVRGVIRIPEGRTAGRDGKRHGDAAVAGAMAYAASRADPEIYEYTPAPSPFAMEGRPSERGGWPIEDELAAERAGVRMDNMGLRGSIY